MIQTQITARRIKTGSTVQVYKVADTQPATPTGTAIPPSGWTTTPPSSGRIWVSTASAVNNKVSGSWSTPVRWNGDKGDSGVPGQIVRQSEWFPGVEYHNDGESITPVRYLDVVLVYAANGVVSRYVCEKTHTASESTKPSVSSNSNWTLLSGNFPLYTPLLVAENGDIKFLQSNRILIQKPDRTITAGISGEGEGKDGIRFWAGGEFPNNANYKVHEDGTLIIANGKIRLNPDGSGLLANGNISWDENGNPTVVGKISTNMNGKRIEINPSTQSFKMYNNKGNEVCSMHFLDENGMHDLPQITLSSYNVSGVKMAESYYGSARMSLWGSTGSTTYRADLNPVFGLMFYVNGKNTKTYPSQ